jgi:holliday junction DNA helicase RuvB
MNNLSSPAPISLNGINAGSSPITYPKELQEDRNLDITLRPRSFKEYAGQEKIKDNLKIIIEAAKKRGEAVEHLLLHGSSGLGKLRWLILLPKKLAPILKLLLGRPLKKQGT